MLRQKLTSTCLTLGFNLLGYGLLPFLFLGVLLRGRSPRVFARRLGFLPPLPDDRPVIWIHGVSVGEVKAAERFVQALRQRLPTHRVVISTTTDTGEEVARKSYPDLDVIRYPLDIRWAVRRALRRIHPALVILIELEIWPNFLAESYARDLPVVLINGRISEQSFRNYRHIRNWLFTPLTRIFYYCVQDQLYADRFIQLGVAPEQVIVTGSMKFDNLQHRIDETLRAGLRAELGLAPDQRLWICGSTHRDEEQLLLAIYRRLIPRFPELRLALVPRHPERFDACEALIGAAGLACRRRSRRVPGGALDNGSVLLMDSIGELAHLYHAADLAFVGGSLIPHGGQNMLEPAALGLPVIVGPHTHNFRGGVEILLRCGGLLQVAGDEQLQEALAADLADPASAAARGERAQAQLLKLGGATEKTLDLILDILETACPRGVPAPAAEREST